MKRNLFWLSLFAISIAYLEAAVVVYLRELYFPENIKMIFPPRMFNSLDIVVELAREISTILIMLSVAFLTERKNATRIFAAFVYQFGMWDIFYYLWLKVLIGWPLSWTEWDILFLIPWTWLGPWICPALIALLFVVWGGTILLSEREFRFAGLNLWIFIIGALLDLAAFLQPAMQYILKYGVEAFTQYQPGGFWWWMFIPGYFLMIVGLFRPFYLRKQVT